MAFNTNSTFPGLKLVQPITEQGLLHLALSQVNRSVERKIELSRSALLYVYAIKDEIMHSMET